MRFPARAAKSTASWVWCTRSAGRASRSAGTCRPPAPSMPVASTTCRARSTHDPSGPSRCRRRGPSASVGVIDVTAVEPTTSMPATVRYHCRNPCHATVGKKAMSSHAASPYTASNHARGLTAGTPHVGQAMSFGVRSVCMRAYVVHGPVASTGAESRTTTSSMPRRRRPRASTSPACPPPTITTGCSPSRSPTHDRASPALNASWCVASRSRATRRALASASGARMLTRRRRARRRCRRAGSCGDR